ncbi:ATP-binding protein [Cyanobium gracile]|uniref:ATP-binding protein n=1 Tax=Cyanobium gracile UHCC 0281 TaxID=3110309 RepID=A0ABU5SVF2_9CYAN|nr:ATP-binding protein [Cyanobium gracile]MEA5442017.1 ATP-binding protein [Cyanobium gracile UHCC 0281]
MNPSSDGEFKVPFSQLTVVSHLDELESVLTWFDRLTCSAVPEELWMQAQLALVEGFTNAVRHAHAHLVPAPQVVLSVEVKASTLRVEIIDRGEPFDFESAVASLQKEVAASTADPLAREAHWGLVMLLKLRTDYGWSINYSRQEGMANCLTLSHPLNGKKAGDASC